MKKNNFILGYSYVIHSFISWLCLGFVFVVISNTIIPTAVAMYGWNSTLLSTINTVGGVIGAAAGLAIGQWVERKGPKQAIIVGFIASGVVYIVMGFTSSLALFILLIILGHVGSQAFCQMTTNNLIARWFVKKKGAVLGITTAGLPCATALLVPLTSYLNTNYGLHASLGVIGAGMVIVGVLSIFWVKNTPQEVGLTPDNLPIDPNVKPPVEKAYTFAQVIRRKDSWQFIVSYGLMYCATIASTARVVAYCMSKGYDQAGAVTIAGLAALCGIVGSAIFGIIDQATNTKIATIIYTIAALVVYIGMFFAGKGAVIPLCVLAFALNGAPGNLLPSMMISKYGSENFNAVFKLIMPPVAMLRSFGYVFAAACVVIFGGNAGGVYAGLAVLMVVSLIVILFVDMKKPINLDE